ncbi:hypothetical protein [Plesiocystis pacifica]|nr:hypothetical protein [Plesiocystis pacifica]
MPQPEHGDLAAGIWGPLLGPAGNLRVRAVDEEPEPLPDFDVLLDTLGELSELLGAPRCATAYQLYTPEDLPESWDRELVDQRALIRRLLRYAGEDDESLGVRVVDGRRPDKDVIAEHLAGELRFAGLSGEDQRAAGFVVSSLGDLRAMLGPTCVEVARALVHRARLERGRNPDGPRYRGEEAEGEGAELPTAVEGFLACFALGWGVPVTNACLDPRSVAEGMGEMQTTAWVSASLRYPPDVAAELLATLYAAGARDAKFVEGRRGALNPSQREVFDEAWAALEEDGPNEAAALREQLRWGAPDSWPEPATREPALAELEFDAHDDALVDAEERYQERLRLPNLGKPVFRARPRRTWQGALIGSVVGVLFGGAIGGAVGGGIGALFGYSWRPSLCSGPRCGVVLEVGVTECPKCGGTIMGEIARTKDHLAAVEALEEQGALNQASDPT